MASDPESLRDLRSSYSVTYREVLRLLGGEKSYLVGIVEGKDAPYYFIRIDSWRVARALDAELKLVDARGKGNVLNVRRAVDQNPSICSKYVFYIVDRDFALSNYQRVDTYETDSYSVESYYTSKQFVRKVVSQEILGGDSSVQVDELLDKLETLYVQAASSFIQQMEELHCWMRAQRKNFSGRVPLSSLDKMSFCSVNMAEAECQVGLRPVDTHQLPSPEHHPTSEQVAESREDIGGNLQIEMIRGKQAVCFVASFLAAVNDEIRREGSDLYSEQGRKVDFGVKSFIKYFSTYADTSPSLIEFFDNFYEDRLAA